MPEVKPSIRPVDNEFWDIRPDVKIPRNVRRSILKDVRERAFVEYIVDDAINKVSATVAAVSEHRMLEKTAKELRVGFGVHPQHPTPERSLELFVYLWDGDALAYELHIDPFKALDDWDWRDDDPAESARSIEAFASKMLKEAARLKKKANRAAKP